MPCPRKQHLNNVPRLRGEKHDISLKILHQTGFETARQAATSAERHALTIAPCPSLYGYVSFFSLQGIVYVTFTIFKVYQLTPCGNIAPNLFTQLLMQTVKWCAIAMEG